MCILKYLIVLCFVAVFYFVISDKKMSMFGMLNLCILMICMLEGSHGYSTGAPERACQPIRPFHGTTDPQTTPSPYNITLSQDSYVPNDEITGNI